MQNLFILIVIVAVLLLVSCAGFVQTGTGRNEDSRKNLYSRSLSSLPAEQRTAWKELKEFMRIVDDSTYKQLERLSVTEEAGEIDSLVNAFYKRKDLQYNPETPDTNEWLGEMKKRIAYCNEHYAGPGVIGRHWDPRARATLLLGIPFMETEFESFCVGLTTTSKTKYCMIYKQEFVDGTTFYYQGRISDLHPDKMIPFKEHGAVTIDDFLRQKSYTEWKVGRLQEPEFSNFPDGKELEMGIRLFSCPDTTGNFGFWTISGVSLKKLHPDSANQLRFHSEVAVYTAGRDPQLVCQYKSPVYTLPGHLADNGNAVFPIHLGRMLPPGYYTASVSLFEEGTDNKAVYSLDVQLPSQYATNGFSDLLLLRDITDKPKKNRIRRYGRSILADVNLVFQRGDTIHTYFDAILPRENLNFSVVAVLHRIPKMINTRIRRDDIDGTIIFNERFRSPNQLFQFGQSLEIPRKIKTGDYFLALFIRDVNQQEYGYCYTQIKIE